MRARPEIVRLAPLSQLLRLPAMLLALAIVFLYVRIWGRAPVSYLFADAGAIATLVGAYVLSIPLHEALHVFGFRRLGKAPPGSTRIRWAGLSAFTHCAAPVRAGPYRAAVALPGLVLGVVPVVVGLVSGLALPTLYGALLTGSAIGDARVLLALRNVPANATVQFVAEHAGYEIIRQPE